MSQQEIYSFIWPVADDELIPEDPSQRLDIDESLQAIVADPSSLEKLDSRIERKMNIFLVQHECQPLNMVVSYLCKRPANEFTKSELKPMYWLKSFN